MSNFIFSLLENRIWHIFTVNFLVFKVSGLLFLLPIYDSN